MAFGVSIYVCHILSMLLVFFFKQKTAYEMRISDWSSDVCSSDLASAATDDAAAAMVSITRSRRDACSRTGSVGKPFMPDGNLFSLPQIGRASCRERVWQYG